MTEAAAETTSEGASAGEDASGGVAVAKRRPSKRVTGVVASDKADKTIRVLVEYQTQHKKYQKYIKRRTVLHAHDEANDAREGDRVEVSECRPLSKTKHHRLVRIVERAPERAVQVKAEDVMKVEKQAPPQQAPEGAEEAVAASDGE